MIEVNIDTWNERKENMCFNLKAVHAPGMRQE